MFGNNLWSHYPTREAASDPVTSGRRSAGALSADNSPIAASRYLGHRNRESAGRRTGREGS